MYRSTVVPSTPIGNVSNDSDSLIDKLDLELESESDKWIWPIVIALISLTLCAFGLVSNLTSVVIYSHNQMRSPINILLAGLSLIDLSLCFLSIPGFCIPNIAMYFFQNRVYGDYAAVYIYPFCMITQSCSIFAFVVISIERFVAVCWPFRARWCTIGRSLRALAMASVAAFLYNIPRFFEYRIVHAVGIAEEVTSEPFLRNSTQHPVYMTLYYCFLYLLTHFALPFSILLFTNTFMITAVYRAHRQRRLLSNQERREHKTAFMMIVVVCEFLVCNTLPFVLNIVELLDQDFFIRSDTVPVAWVLNDMATGLVIFQASTTAVIYAACSEKYRRLLYTLWLNLWSPVLGSWMKTTTRDRRLACRRAAAVLGGQQPYENGSAIGGGNGAEAYEFPRDRARMIENSNQDRRRHPQRIESSDFVQATPRTFRRANKALSLPIRFYRHERLIKFDATEETSLYIHGDEYATDSGLGIGYSSSDAERYAATEAQDMCEISTIPVS